MEKFLNSVKLPLVKKALYLFLTVVSAVILPQIVHAAGVITGTGAVIGQILMPMYFPVLIFGLCAGPVAGAATGIISPLISFAVTGMPAASVLPFITLELFAFGLFAGIFNNIKISPVLKVLSVQLISRFLRVLATVAAVYLFKNASVGITATVSGMLMGIPGMLLQLLSVPYIVKKVGRF